MSWARRVSNAWLTAAIVSIGSLVASCGPRVTQLELKAGAQCKELYHALACDSCHGLNAVGSTRTYAPLPNSVSTPRTTPFLAEFVLFLPVDVLTLHPIPGSPGSDGQFP